MPEDEAPRYLSGTREVACAMRMPSSSRSKQEITTTRWFERMTLRSTSFRRAASATPVWGQLNMPVRSARAASSASSDSLACSTTPLNCRSTLTARL